MGEIIIGIFALVGFSIGVFAGLVVVHRPPGGYQPAKSDINQNQPGEE